MNKNIGAIIAGVVIVVGLIFFGMWWSTTNKEATLRAQVDAQQDNCKVVYDNTWKIIKQQAEISDQYAEKFKENFAAIMEGRYGHGEGDPLLNFVKESNPEFKIDLYAKLANSVEAQRNNFTRYQQTLIDKNREHNLMFKVKPSKWFLDLKDTTSIVLLTSARTKGNYETGEDNDVELYQ
jgi:hypothetical protein